MCQKIHTELADVAGDCNVIMTTLRANTMTSIAQSPLRPDVNA